MCRVPNAECTFFLFHHSEHSRVQHAITKLEHNRGILPANKNINFATQTEREREKRH